MANLPKRGGEYNRSNSTNFPRTWITIISCIASIGIIALSGYLDYKIHKDYDAYILVSMLAGIVGCVAVPIVAHQEGGEA